MPALLIRMSRHAGSSSAQVVRRSTCAAPSPASWRRLGRRNEKRPAHPQRRPFRSQPENGRAAGQRIVQRAAIQLASSGGDEVTGANVLVALIAERESDAVYFT